MGTILLLTNLAPKKYVLDIIPPHILRYTPPEVLCAIGQDQETIEYTKESDIYAFGCLMAELLTFQEPYARMRRPEAVIAMRMRGEPPFERLPAHLYRYQGLIDECLAEDPAMRPSSQNILEQITSLVHENL